MRAAIASLFLCACGAVPAVVAREAPASQAPEVSTVVAPPAAPPAPVAPAATGPALAVELRGGVAQVRGVGFEPGERITVSLDEHDGEGYGECHGEQLLVTVNAHGVFRARLHVPPCGAELCGGWRRQLGVSADWACGSDCRRGLVTPACPDAGAAKSE